jgi:hypothetical protein
VNSPTQACATFLDDVRHVVSEEARAALSEHHEPEHRLARVLTRIEAVMLPIAILTIWMLTLAHLPEILTHLCESLTLAPNSLSALVRLASGH